MARLYASVLFVALLARLAAEAARTAPSPWAEAMNRWLGSGAGR